MPKSSQVKLAIRDLKGDVIKQVSLPQGALQQALIPALLAQAVRVFQFNQRKNQRPVKTRAQVSLSGRKIYAQKGTGRARHGSRRAPIFVGGGKAHGPKGWLVRLKLPKKMKRKVLAMVLSRLYQDKKLIVIDAWPKFSKTKRLDHDIAVLVPNKQGRYLLIYHQKAQTDLYQTGRNLPYLTIRPVNQVSFMDLLKSRLTITDYDSFKELLTRSGYGS